MLFSIAMPEDKPMKEEDKTTVGDDGATIEEVD